MLQPSVTGWPLALVNAVPENLTAVHADPNRLQQILFNLLGNAIKFTEHGLIEVSAEQEGRLVRVHIKDTGIGIPPAQLETIFEKFTQADDSERRARDGAGLGLTIAQRLVTLMGGQLMLQSKQHQGSTFSFTLPLQEPK
jgi:signal transduction histidine kinase